MKLFILYFSFAALAVATQLDPDLVDRAPTITTKTVSSCPVHSPTPGVTYVPFPPTKCRSLTTRNITYQLYTEKCYRQVYGGDGDPIDRGETYSDLTLKQVCAAATRCANFASDPDGPGYNGGGTDYSFAVYYGTGSSGGSGSWQCYTYYGQGTYPKPGYKPPFNETNPSYSTDAFGWYQPLK